MDKSIIYDKRFTRNKSSISSNSIKEKGSSISNIDEPSVLTRQTNTDMCTCDYPSNVSLSINERNSAKESELILNLVRIQADRFNRLKHHVNVVVGVIRDCKPKGNTDVHSSCTSLEASLRRDALEIEHRLSKLSIQGCSKQSNMPSTPDTTNGSCS